MKLLTAVMFALVSIAPAFGATGGDDDKRAAVALKGLDPVSLVGGEEVVGKGEFASTRGRLRYLFADAEHKARFDADPDRYAAQNDGMCTVMPKVPGSPDLFLVHEGRIYLFGRETCRDRFREDPATYLKPRRKVAVLVYEGMELLDFAGPGEVFADAGGGRAFDVYTVGATAAPVKSQGFVTVTPQFTFADCPRADVLVIPGGATGVPLADPATPAWIRKASGEAEVTLSVCTGSLLLARAGLLDGLEATTHHLSLGELGEAAPKAKVVRGRRFVDNGRIVTSAGVSSGIDASLHVVARLLGPEAAARAAEMMEYRPGPEASAAPR